MPNIEELVDTIGQLISEKKQGEVYFTTMDLTYAYGQLPLVVNFLWWADGRQEHTDSGQGFTG